MKDKEKQIEEMPICVNCIHAYICEEYNLNRDMLRKRCAYHNDHFLDIEQHDTKLRKETAEKFGSELKAFIKVWKMAEDDAMSIPFYRALFSKIGELTKQSVVEIKES